jgi:putative flippase GtrA
VQVTEDTRRGVVNPAEFDFGLRSHARGGCGENASLKAHHHCWKGEVERRRRPSPPTVQLARDDRAPAQQSGIGRATGVEPSHLGVGCHRDILEAQPEGNPPAARVQGDHRSVYDVPRVTGRRPDVGHAVLAPNGRQRRRQIPQPTIAKRATKIMRPLRELRAPRSPIRPTGGEPPHEAVLGTVGCELRTLIPGHRFVVQAEEDKSLAVIAQHHTTNALHIEPSEAHKLHRLRDTELAGVLRVQPPDLFRHPSIGRVEYERPIGPQHTVALDQEARDIVWPKMLDDLAAEHQVDGLVADGGDVSERAPQPRHMRRQIIRLGGEVLDADMALDLARIQLIEPLEIPPFGGAAVQDASGARGQPAKLLSAERMQTLGEVGTMCALGAHQEPDACGDQVAGNTIDAMSDRFFELVRYGLVGLVNVGTYLGLYSLLVVLNVPYVLAAIVAYPLPVALGYWLHEHWTFARSEPTMRRLGIFLILQACAFGVGLGLLVLLVNGFGWNPIVARLVATPVGPLVTYVASRILIFSSPAALDPVLNDSAR